MTKKQAVSRAIKDYLAKLLDAKNTSHSHGCYGIIGETTEIELLEELISDYEEYLEKDDKNPYQPKEPEYIGRYANSSDGRFPGSDLLR